MRKIDPTVLKETTYIGGFTFILSLLMQSVFLIIGEWEYTVLLGNVLGAVASVGNFFLLGLTVQSAVLREEKDAKSLMKLSQTLRIFLLFIVAVIGYAVPFFNTIAVVVPYLFPRIAIAIRPVFMKHDDE